MSLTRTSLLTLTTASLLALASHASATVYTLEANLDGLQEVPPNASPAFGLADLSYDDALQTFTITSGTYQDLLGGATAVTLNDAAVGSTGPLIQVLTLDTPAATSGTFSGTGPLTPAVATDLLAGNTYINIRSNVFPSGEIRGQLFVSTPEPASLALLTPALLPLLKRRKK